MFIPTPKQVGIIYPIELIVGCFISFLISSETKEYHTKNYYLLRSGNIFNKVFAYNGNLIWLLLFICIALIQYQLRTNEDPLLPAERRVLTVTRKHKLQIVKEYFAKFIIKLFLLDLVFLFIDGVFLLTGGSCTVPNRSISAEKCKKLGGRWNGGFDISGHFCFLINISMILWLELSSIGDYLKAQTGVNTFKRVHSYLISVILAVLCIWASLLLVTSIYYHTLPEKIIGCCLGYLCPIVMYYLIPANDDLKKFFYAYTDR
ncbi:hypothetical protein RNJ44_03958 [Nakaseomyces bracarensis]|uniref:Acyl-coenzyme A diphosphatase YFT2 n=1 Tax=Nakaseomyces bracarensis TaxID=273131 RepID=A0ABR4NYU2_9SACH